MFSFFYKLAVRRKETLKEIHCWGFLRKAYRIIRGIQSRIDYRDWATSPPVIAYFLQDIIKGKTVCDVGCRKGFLMKDFQKYAKKVVGVEEKECFWKICKKKGLNVELGDAETMKMPIADIYFMWVASREMQRVIQNLKSQNISGIFVARISVGDTELKEGLVFNIKKGLKIQIIYF